MKRDFPIQPTLVEKGRGLFASLGCASCHQLHEGNKAITSGLTAPPSSNSAPAGLPPEPPGQGSALVSPQPGTANGEWRGVKAPASAGKLSPPRDHRPHPDHLQLLRLPRARQDGRRRGGSNKLFSTDATGDGRRGPRAAAARRGRGQAEPPIISSRFSTRGPTIGRTCRRACRGFGDANVGHLVDGVRRRGQAPPVAAVTFKEPCGKVKAAARHMVGGQALGCIKCHTFAGNKAEGVQGIDMLLMPKRVKRDWFHATCSTRRDSAGHAHAGGLVMNGKSALARASSTATPRSRSRPSGSICSTATRPQLPVGMGTQSIPLEPVKEAIIYRNFIAGRRDAGHRRRLSGKGQSGLRRQRNAAGAAVARGVHRRRPALDRPRRRLRAAAGRQHPAPPGRRQLCRAGEGRATPGPPNPVVPCPAIDSAVIASLPDQRPTFLYSVAGVQVEDCPNPVAGVGKQAPSVRRTLTLTAPRPVENPGSRRRSVDKIEALGDGRLPDERGVDHGIQSPTGPHAAQGGGESRSC